jgi:hypothetical protein
VPLFAGRYSYSQVWRVMFSRPYIYRALALTDVAAGYEAAMRVFPVR